MTAIPDPYSNPDPWGRVLCSGTTMPGILTAIQLPGRAYEWAVQNGYGSTKVAIYRAPNLLESVKITHYITPGQFELVQGFMNLLIPGFPERYKQKPKAFSWTHPALQWLGLNRASLKSYDAPTQISAGDPSYLYTIELIEWSPKLTVPTGPPEPAKINGPPAPKDALEATFLQAVAAFKAL